VVVFDVTAVTLFRLRAADSAPAVVAGPPAIQRRSISRPGGTATHKNHGPPLAPPSSQITKATTLNASQNRQAARHARADPPAGTCTGPGARRSASRPRSVPGKSATSRPSSPRVVAA